MKRLCPHGLAIEFLVPAEAKCQCCGRPPIAYSLPLRGTGHATLCGPCHRLPRPHERFFTSDGSMWYRVRVIKSQLAHCFVVLDLEENRHNIRWQPSACRWEIVK